jgi:hypothetical protein
MKGTTNHNTNMPRKEQITTVGNPDDEESDRLTRFFRSNGFVVPFLLLLLLVGKVSLPVAEFVRRCCSDVMGCCYGDTNLCNSTLLVACFRRFFQVAAGSLLIHAPPSSWS